MIRIVRGCVIAAALVAAPAFAQEPEAQDPAAEVKPDLQQTISPEAEAAGLTTLEKRTSYAIGVQFGKMIKDSPITIEQELVEKGMTDSMGGEPVLSATELQELLANLNDKYRSASQERAMKQGEENLAKGNTFLEENKGKEGWKTTESGLQYKVIEEGEGASPKATDTVRVHYRGTLTDGTVFDSSYDRGQPAQFALNQVIDGWTEGLQLMKPGAKYSFAIPAELGYGMRSPSPSIPPNSVLLFDVELLEIVAPETGANPDGSVTIDPGN